MLIFDFKDSDDDAAPLCFVNPVQVITADSSGEVCPALSAVEASVKTGLYAAGYLTYEAAPAFDHALVVREEARHPRRPLLWFGLFDRPCDGLPWISSPGYELSAWEPDITAPAYEDAVARVREKIECGETYQVNYTFRLQARFNGDPLAFYRQLRSRQAAPYSAYLKTGRSSILSLSPELFFTIRDRQITTRPMKGTVRRGRSTAEDEELSRWLAQSEKNRAENVMIVDLVRNDLGRIARTGSVRVSSLYDVERYPTVFQMTSTVTAELRPEISLAEVFGALFPCGSVTGAPKIAAMKIIAELENRPRNVYCGAIGFLSPRGTATFNVAIRTLTIDHSSGCATYGTGGGITWDSTATDEYDEALLKAELLRRERPGS